MADFEVLFLTGLVVGFVASHGFIPREQHDARGVTILICMFVAVATGWLLVQAGAPHPVAWLIAAATALASARAAVHRARRSAVARRSMLSRHSSNRQLPNS